MRKENNMDYCDCGALLDISPDGLHCVVCFEQWRQRQQPTRPTVVCLCGSTRFYKAFQEANLKETLAGKIVLTIGCDTKRDADVLQAPKAKQACLKEHLDWLHQRKIDLADEILVLNVRGYVGISTAREISYAASQGKRIRWLTLEV
jgi:hypothetical protein